MRLKATRNFLLTFHHGQVTLRCKSALGAYFRRMQGRMGAPKAITATAHKLARIFYCLWSRGDVYNDPGIDAYEQQYRDRMLKNLKKKAHALGLELVPFDQDKQNNSSTQILAT